MGPTLDLTTEILFPQTPPTIPESMYERVISSTSDGYGMIAVLQCSLVPHGLEVKSEHRKSSLSEAKQKLTQTIGP